MRWFTGSNEFLYLISMASYLDWNLLFYKPFYATGKDEIKNNAEVVKELMDLGGSL